MAKKKKYTKAEVSAMLPEKVAEKFEIVDIEFGSSRKVFPKFGEVNFKTISEAKAEQLVKMKFPYLKKK